MQWENDENVNHMDDDKGNDFVCGCDSLYDHLQMAQCGGYKM